MGKLLAVCGVLLLGTTVAVVLALRSGDDPAESDDRSVAATPSPPAADRRPVEGPASRRPRDPSPTLRRLARSPSSSEAEPVADPTVIGPPKNAEQLNVFLSDLLQQGIEAGRFEGALVARGINAIGALEGSIGPEESTRLQREFLGRIQGAAGATATPTKAPDRSKTRTSLKQLSEEISRLPDDHSRQKRLSEYLTQAADLDPEEREEYLQRLQRALRQGDDHAPGGGDDQPATLVPAP